MPPETPKNTIAFIAVEPSAPGGNVRREARTAVQVPVLLRRESGEQMPGVATDVSASGLCILVDGRFFASRGLTTGARLACELYFGDVGVRDVALDLHRIDEVGHHQLELGCGFIELPDRARVGIRREVARRLAAARPANALRRGR